MTVERAYAVRILRGMSNPPPPPNAFYSINRVDTPTRMTRLDTGDEDDYFAACDIACVESLSTPSAVEVWQEGAHGPSVRRRYIGGEEVPL